MKKSRFTESQIVGILKEADSGVPVNEAWAALREHLKREADSRAYANPNSWKAAMYRSLADSEWFHEKGYLQIT